MTIKLLLGIAGPAQCGKSTAQQILCDRFGLIRINFADPIKEGLAAMFGLEGRHLQGSAKEAPHPWLGHSPRELMQTLGTEWGRDTVNRDIWVRAAQQRLAMIEDIEGPAFQGAAFSDIRYSNEADWVRANGGTVIHIYRPGTASVRAHTSECGIAMARDDLVLNNNGDLDDLRMHLTAAVDALIDRRAAS